MAEMSAETPSLQTSSDSWALIDHPSLGRTLRATSAIAAGEVLLAERPALLATPLRSLSKAQRAAFKAAAEDEDHDLEDLLVAHAFAHAGAEKQKLVLAGACGDEVVADPEHPLLRSARRAATCAAALDEACAQAIDGVYRCLCIFALNGFGYLADGLTGGGIALYLTGSKFTHCCLRPNCHFHGQNGRLTFRSVRPIEAGEILTIDYLGPCGECAAPRRLKQLLAAKAFECACIECALPDTLRPLPCPRCAPRDAASGLLLLAAPDDAEPACVTRDGSVAADCRTEPAWRCERCGAALSDDEVDVPCRAPAEWAGEGEWPLRMAPAGLLAWETGLGEAVSNLVRSATERAVPGVGGGDTARATATMARSRKTMPTIRAAAAAVVGPQHWVCQALAEAQLDHWLELLLEHAPGEYPPAAAEDFVLEALENEGSVVVESVDALFARAEAALLALWRRRQRTALADHILESATELCAARKAWAKSGGAEELRPILEANARRTEIEYGPASEDASQARAVLEGL